MLTQLLLIASLLTTRARLTGLSLFARCICARLRNAGLSCARLSNARLRAQLCKTQLRKAGKTAKQNSQRKTDLCHIQQFSNTKLHSTTQDSAMQDSAMQDSAMQARLSCARVSYTRCIVQDCKTAEVEMQDALRKVTRCKCKLE